jgi:hypothetical protein
MIILIFILLTGIFILQGCNLPFTAPEAESVSQEDVSEAEAPVEASATSTSAPTQSLTPTETPTETPTPTTTPTQFTETPTPEVSRTPRPSMTASPTAPGNLATPTAIQWLPDPSIPDPPDIVYYYDCEILDQVPGGFSDFAPNTQFDLYWRVRNVGSAQWEADHYYFKYLDGAHLEENDDKYEFDQLVGPTQDIDFTVDFQAPSKPGVYETHWGIVNVDTNEVACHLYFAIRVQ